MNWVEVFTTIISNVGFIIGLFLWNRSQTRSDHLHLQTQSRTDFLHLQSQTDTLLNAIHLEMKDFHGRLCAIEERKKMEK